MSPPSWADLPPHTRAEYALFRSRVPAPPATATHDGTTETFRVVPDEVTRVIPMRIRRLRPRPVRRWLPILPRRWAA